MDVLDDPGEDSSNAAVLCAQPSCGHGFPEHEPGGGCRADPCPCPGFRWVPAQGPALGYGVPQRLL